MATFLLVHGAWGGSYGFRKLRPLLQQVGHEVFTPSLTGIGERAHLTGPTVGLDTHIADVVNAVWYEDLTDVVLLGFSYGGMVVTGALDHLGDRVSRLIYLDAFVPADGESASDLWLGSLPTGVAGEGWAIDPLPRDLGSPEANEWSNARRVPQPVRTLTQSIALATPLEQRGLPLTYIKATADPNESSESGFWQAARHAQSSEAWDYREIDTNHMVPFTRPAELAELLDRIVR